MHSSQFAPRCANVGDTVYVPLSPAQRFWYLRLLNRVDSMTLSEIFAAPPPKSTKITEVGGIKDEDESDEAAGEGDVLKNVKQAMASSSSAEGSSWKTMMNLLMQLRKTCNHPFVLLPLRTIVRRDR